MYKNKTCRKDERQTSAMMMIEMQIVLFNILIDTVAVAIQLNLAIATVVMGSSRWKHERLKFDKEKLSLKALKTVATGFAVD